MSAELLLLPTQEQVDAFALEQFHIYGPQSARFEHFAFVYWLDGVLSQSHISARCTNSYACTINPARSLNEIPKRAKLLAEWHTHPHDGARTLSIHDVQGAHAIGEQVRKYGRDYRAYYSDPAGHVFRWDTTTRDTLAANRSRVQIGSYVTNL